MVKALTKTQERKIRTLVKKGKSQYDIAIAIGVRKQTISTFLKKVKIGKRAAPKGVIEYWRDVSKLMKLLDLSRSEASEITKASPKWVKRKAARAGKKWSPIPERQKFWKDWRKAWREAIGEEQEELREKARRWKQTQFYGDTPQ